MMKLKKFTNVQIQKLRFRKKHVFWRIIFRDRKELKSSSTSFLCVLETIIYCLLAVFALFVCLFCLCVCLLSILVCIGECLHWQRRACLVLARVCLSDAWMGAGVCECMHKSRQMSECMQISPHSRSLIVC